MCRCTLVRLVAAAVVPCLWAVVRHRPVAAAMCLWVLAALALAATCRSEPAAPRMRLARVVLYVCQAAMAAAAAAAYV